MTTLTKIMTALALLAIMAAVELASPVSLAGSAPVVLTGALQKPVAASTVQPEDRGGIPWPWALAVNIPIRDLRGVWTILDGTSTNIFVFDTHASKTGSSYMNIESYDPQTCQLLGKGIGYQTDRYIYGQIVSTSGQTVNLSVYAFNRSDVANEIQESSPRDQLGPVDSSSGNFVMAMSMSPLQENETRRPAYEIRRISAQTSQVCRQH